MTRSKALGIGLPVWTLFMVAALFLVPGVSNAPGCSRLVGVLGVECAAGLTAQNLAIFYLQSVPMVAVWLGGYVLVGLQAVRSTRSQLALVALWLAAVVAFAMLARPLPVQPF